MDNSMIISEIKNKYNHSPYYKFGEFISINDDRVGRIVSFKIYEHDNQMFADFVETSQISSMCKRIRNNKIISSLADFEKKYSDFYNDINN